MLKTGSIILSLWSILSMLPALGIVVNTVVSGNTTPIFSGHTVELATLSPQLLATMNSVPVFANGTYAAFCTLLLAVIWFGLNRGAGWVFWTLLASMSIALVSGFAADHVGQAAYPEVSYLSALFIAAGFTCSAIGLFRPGPVP